MAELTIRPRGNKGCSLTFREFYKPIENVSEEVGHVLRPMYCSRCWPAARWQMSFLSSRRHLGFAMNTRGTRHRLVVLGDLLHRGGSDVGARRVLSVPLADGTWAHR